jgi:hypothetical protein
MIDWPSVIATLLTSSTISVVILTVLGFLAKSIFTEILSRDIEKYKSDHQIELEIFKADLTKSSFEHQTRYQSLHTKRAEIIAELYNLLVQAEDDMKFLTQPIGLYGAPSHEERRKLAFESGKSLHEYFERNRIYFQQESCERIASFVQALYHALVDFELKVESVPLDSDGKYKSENWLKIWNKLTEELPLIKADIEKEFREILGLQESLC